MSMLGWFLMDGSACLHHAREIPARGSHAEQERKRFWHVHGALKHRMQVAALLGPKTAADLAKPEKKKKEPKVQHALQRHACIQLRVLLF